MVYVTTLTGKKSAFAINIETTSVEALKTLIAKKEGIPVQQQALTFQGQLLENPLLLSHYNIQPDSLLSLVLRLRGGELSQICPAYISWVL